MRQKLCFGCGNCAVVCPVNLPANWAKSPRVVDGKDFTGSDLALRVIGGSIRMINFRLCDACKECVPACPSNAIEEILRERDIQYAALMRRKRRR